MYIYIYLDDRWLSGARRVRRRSFREFSSSTRWIFSILFRFFSTHIFGWNNFKHTWENRYLHAGGGSQPCKRSKKKERMKKKRRMIEACPLFVVSGVQPLRVRYFDVFIIFFIYGSYIYCVRHSATWCMLYVMYVFIFWNWRFLHLFHSIHSIFNRVLHVLYYVCVIVDIYDS